MTRLTLLSNGHGEDAIGALLAREIGRLRPDLALDAFPLVDEGHAYAEMGLEVLGPRQRMPSGGLLLHSPEQLWADLRAGFLHMTFKQLSCLRRLRTDVLVVVGDLYAQLLSALVNTRTRFVVQPLVSAWHGEGRNGWRLHRTAMETITYPERALMRHLAAQVYVRDARTEARLREHGLRHVQALGNPMLDGLVGTPIGRLAGEGFVLALLPGSRDYAPRALERMLLALTHIPAASAAVGWAGGPLPTVSGWQLEPLFEVEGLVALYRRGTQSVWVFEGRFADVLASADMALGTAGTGNEQAAAAGLPVITFPLEPQYTVAFLENQKRLLGAALVPAAPDPRAIAAAVESLRSDRDRFERASREGRERLGGPGGSRSIAADLLDRAGRRGVL